MWCNEWKRVKYQTEWSGHGVLMGNKGRHRLQYVTPQLRPTAREPSQQQLDHRHRRMKHMVNNIITQGTLYTQA